MVEHEPTASLFQQRPQILLLLFQPPEVRASWPLDHLAWKSCCNIVYPFRSTKRKAPTSVGAFL
jgi:hypothetical protein